ncbi:MAG TPA: hypothetical protein VGO08_23635 [Burkholderiales bacterium]|nr:hypothetical protein [Burkholderiales bacterium]
MKSRTLVTMAVASTFGWSAAALAATGHEVITPFSVSETGENVVQQHRQGFDSHRHRASSDSFSREPGVMNAERYSASSDTFTNEDSVAALNMDENLGLDEGIYSDVYVASWTPASSDDWMSYIEMPPAGQLALSDDITLVPAYEISFMPSGVLAPTQEELVARALVDMPYDSAEVG